MVVADAGLAGGKPHVNADNVAVGGHDLVAYFSQNAAVRGSQNFEATIAGVKYWFASADNQKKFESNPAGFLPQYGGWCAFAMGMNKGTVPSDPKTFKFYNGKLYLFFNDYYQGTPVNTIVPWNAAEASLKAKADVNWSKMKS